MSEGIKKVLEKLTEDYGLCILEDPDRLSQFLEARNPSESAANFRLTFALRYMIKSGWTLNSRLSAKNEMYFRTKLSENLGFSPGDAEGRNYCVIAIEAGDKTPVYGMVVGQTTITEARSIFADYYLIDEGVSKGDVFCDGSYDPSTAGNYELVYYQTDPQESNEGQNDTALVLEFKEDLLCKATLIK